MQCHELEANLTSFLEGELDQDTEAEALKHLATCSHCETVLSETRSVIAASAEFGQERMSQSAHKRLLNSVLDQLGDLTN